MSENSGDDINDVDDEMNIDKMQKLEKLVQMNFSFVKSEIALRNSNWNLERAIEKLITHESFSDNINHYDYKDDYNNSEYDDNSETEDENSQLVDTDSNNIANNYIINGNNTYNKNNSTSSINKNNHLDQEQRDKLEVLIEQMGFSSDKAEEALSNSNWNVESALEQLMIIENSIINTNDIDNVIASAPPEPSSSYLENSLVPPLQSDVIDNISRQLSADSDSKMELYFAIHNDFNDETKQRKEVFEILQNISLGFKSSVYCERDRMKFKETLITGGDLNIVKNMMNDVMKNKGVTKTNIGFNTTAQQQHTGFGSYARNNTINNINNNVESNNSSPRSKIRQEKNNQDEEYLISLKIDKENEIRKENDKNDLKRKKEKDFLYNYTVAMLRFEYYNNLQMKNLSSYIKKEDKVRIRLQIPSFPKQDIWLKPNDSVQIIVDLAVSCILKPWIESEETKAILNSKSININNVLINQPTLNEIIGVNLSAWIHPKILIASNDGNGYTNLPQGETLKDVGLSRGGNVIIDNIKTLWDMDS